MSGRVILVGAGPGDPGLMTLSGMRAVQTADVIVHDRLIPHECLHAARADAEIIAVGKIPRGPFTPQEDINQILISHAQQGKTVVRLKGGDNFIFGRGGEECLACAAAGVDVEVIPGVSSAVAAPALAGIPLTHRSLVQGFTVVSGHVGPDDPRCTLDWSAIARTSTTLVILMGVQELASIVDRLIADGMLPGTPAAIICQAGMPEMAVYRADLRDVVELARAEQVRPPAITVIGEVAGLDLRAPAYRGVAERTEEMDQ